MKRSFKNSHPLTSTGETKTAQPLVVLSVALVLFAGVAFAAFLSRSKSNPPAVSEIISTAKPTTRLAEFLALKTERLEGTDIALMNLLCAEGLPGAESLNVVECLVTLDQWAQHAKRETERNQHRFREDPAYFYNSEAFYKMLMLAVVVYEDFGVR